MLISFIGPSVYCTYYLILEYGSRRIVANRIGPDDPTTLLIGLKPSNRIIESNAPLDCMQSLHKSVERPAFLRQSCFVTQTNKKTKRGLGRGEKERTALFPVTDAFRITKSANLISYWKCYDRWFRLFPSLSRSFYLFAWQNTTAWRDCLQSKRHQVYLSQLYVLQLGLLVF